MHGKLQSKYLAIVVNITTCLKFATPDMHINVLMPLNV